MQAREFAEFDGIHASAFALGAQFSKSFVSTYFTTRAWGTILVGACPDQSLVTGARGLAWQSLCTLSAILLHSPSFVLKGGARHTL